jgi:hypothetical protein
VIDLALLIDEASYEVRGAAINPCFEEALSLAQAEAIALLKQGRRRVGRRLVDNAAAVKPSVMCGMPADVLYQAVSGHSYGLDASRWPERDLARVARHARALIISSRMMSEAWALADAVVNEAGRWIRPYLCCVVMDEHGVLQAVAMEYYMRLAL